MRRRISSPSHKRGHCGAGREHGPVCQAPLSLCGRSGEGETSTKAHRGKNNLSMGEIKFAVVLH